MGCFSSSSTKADHNVVGAQPKAKSKVGSKAKAASSKASAKSKTSVSSSVGESTAVAVADDLGSEASHSVEAAVKGEGVSRDEADMTESDTDLTGSEANTTTSESLSTASDTGMNRLLTSARVDRDIAARPDLDDAVVVVLVGLKGSPELNNRLACASGFDAGRGRYHVTLLAEERVLALTPDKLQPLRSFRLEGIKSRPEVNGRQAHAIRYLPESGRVEVQVDGLDGNLSVRPEHIHLEDQSSLDDIDIDLDLESSLGPDPSDRATGMHFPREVTQRSEQASSLPKSSMCLDTAFALLAQAGVPGVDFEHERLASANAPPGKPNRRFLEPSRGILKSRTRSGARRVCFSFGSNEEELSEAARAVESFLFEPALGSEPISNALPLCNTPEGLYRIASALKFAASKWESSQTDQLCDSLFEDMSEDSLFENIKEELGERTNLQRMPVAEIELRLRVRLLMNNDPYMPDTD